MDIVYRIKMLKKFSQEEITSISRFRTRRLRFAFGNRESDVASDGAKDEDDYIPFLFVILARIPTLQKWLQFSGGCLIH